MPQPNSNNDTMMPSRLRRHQQLLLASVAMYMLAILRSASISNQVDDLFPQMTLPARYYGSWFSTSGVRPYTKVCCESNKNHTACCMDVMDENIGRLYICERIRSSHRSECTDLVRKDDYGDEEPIIKDPNRRGKTDHWIHPLLIHENDDPYSSGTMYSHCRGDRSGEVIRDALTARAYAFRHNLTFGGVCELQRRQRRRKVVRMDRDLIKSLGLEALLPIGCPPGINQKSRIHDVWQMPHYLPVELGVTSTFVYTKGEVVGWDMAFKNIVDSRRSKLQETSATRQRPYTIAVHIRRGDVDKCGRFKERYLPNSYYLSLIDEYLAAYEKEKRSGTASIFVRPRVVIFSESNADEPLDVFRQRGYEMKLDLPLDETWKGMMDSDVLIMSKSSFSVVPGFLMPLSWHSAVVCPPMQYVIGEDLDWWRLIDADSALWKATLRRMDELCEVVS